MKNSCYVAVCLIAMLFAITPVMALQKGAREVIATGEGLIENKNIPAARHRAIEEALRRSVEQELGLLISSETIVKNYRTLEDKIFSKSQGYVLKYSILSEHALGNRYRVSIRALVSLESIKNDLMAFGILKQQMHNPRLMIVVGTRSGQVDAAARSVRIQLEKTLAEKHFDLVDPAASERLHNNTKMLLDVTKDTVIAAKMGLDYHAEVVLTGIVDSEHTPKSDISHDKARTTLTLRVIDASTAKILASTEESATGVASRGDEALSRAGVKASERAAIYASNEVQKWWNELKNTGTPYRITLKGVNRYPDAVLFEDTVQSIDNVVSLNERVFGGGFLECDVMYKGKKSNLTRAIFSKLSGKPGFENLNVEITTGNNIILSR
jgi:hypothetical protein